MTYRVRSNRAARMRVVRKKPGCTLDGVSAGLMALYSADWGEELLDNIERAKPWFTPNEKWVPGPSR